MQKFITTFLFIILLINPAMAESQTSKTLSRIENNLFGIEYKNQSETQRLSRIEEQVYGEAKNGSIKSRLNDLSNDIATNQMGQEITPKKDTFDEEEDNYFSQEKLAQSQQQEYSEPSNPKIEYPAVNELEEEVFGKTFKNLSINERLAQLEKKTFKQTFEDALSDRVDRLKNIVVYSNPNKNLEENNFYQDDNYFSPNTVAQNPEEEYFLDEDFSGKEVSERKMKSKLRKLEKNVFQREFQNDTVDNRLARLEERIFNTKFEADNDSTRLNRISSAVEAQKSAKKYDSNGFQQKMATAMQIGMFVLMIAAMIL